MTGFEADLPPAADELEVWVQAEKFTGWTQVEFTRAIDAVSGKFKITVPPTAREVWPIRPGDPLELWVQKDLILRGYVDAFEGSSDATRGRTVSIEGRDKTADLVDCSAMNEPGQWTGLRAEQLVLELVKPFGLKVENRRSQQDPFPVFKLQPGETAWGAIDRVCRLRGILPYSDGSGGVVLAAPGDRSAEADLIEGGPSGNVKASRIMFGHQQRFSTYTVRGQQRGSDEGWGSETGQVEGGAVDAGVIRKRPLLVIAEGSVSVADARARAEWEAISRAGAGTKVEVTVQGWRQGPNLPLWAPNLTVWVSLPSWQLAATMLIRAVRFTRNQSQGTTAQLSLVRRDAYQSAPAVNPDLDPFDNLLAGEDLTFPEE